MSTTDQKVKKAIGLREKYFASITTTHDLINQPTKASEFLARAARVDATFASFENAQEDLIGLNALLEEKSQVSINSQSAACEELYYRIKAHQESITPKPESPPPVASASTENPKARIPKIVIEPFNGEFEKYRTFKSLYDTLIHNSNLSTIEKFSYLRSLVQGKALQTLQSIDFTEENYEFAYNKLKDEYSNQRVVATHYLNKLLQFKGNNLESSDSLRSFIDGFFVSVKSLIDLRINGLSDFILLHIALRAIPTETRKAFENEHIGKKELPTLRHLNLFLKNRLSILEIVDPSSSQRSKPHPKNSLITTDSSDKTSASSSSGQASEPSSKGSSTCKCCHGNHKLSSCDNFLKMDFNAKRDFIKKSQLCFACFGSHMISKCNSRYSCKTCSQKSHHSLLHNPQRKENTSTSQPRQQSPPANQPPTSDTSSTSTSLSCLTPETKNVLLGTAMVKVQDVNGRFHPARLVIDPGSMVNLVTSSLIQTLRLPKTHCSIDIAGIGHTLQTAKGKVNLTIGSQSLPQQRLNISAIVLPSISAHIPSQPIHSSVAMKFRNLPLADYTIFEKSSKVDILLGAAHFAEIIKSDKVVIKGQPSAFSTIFGYVLIGEVDSSVSTPPTSLFTCIQEESSLNNIVKQFWEVEDLPQPKPSSPEDIMCEEHFEKTHYRDEDGKFVVSLPFKDNKKPDLGSTRQIALQRFSSLERRLEKDSRIKSLYHADIQGYIDEDQIEPAKIPADYVLPHHGVIKQSSSHPLRIVFNASQSSTTSKNLNDSMYIGPKLQPDVGDIILLYRLHPVSLCADIRQMYRAIVLNPADRKYQHIFWRFNKEEEVQEWELKRLTFGFTPASYLAQKCIRKLAETSMNHFPRASKVLLENCYVDDIITGADTPEDARSLRDELVLLLQSGGFILKKFSSSSNQVLEDIPLEDQEKSLVLDTSESIKILGLLWDPNSDCFRYSINTRSCVMSKRNLLSQAASVFDVNGYVTHLVIFLKIMIQKCWLLQIDWDSPIPDYLQTQWSSFVSELPLLADLHIPRYIATVSGGKYELVAFSDSSSQALAATVYLRSEAPDGTVKCNLIRAKSKVAPLKVLSIPRLELIAAHLLIKVLKSLQFLIQRLNIKNIVCFTDSTVVLAWIQTPPHQLKTFVANRVAEIVTDLPTQWCHISTKLNPADLATRGLLPSQVIENYQFWFHGPPFLLEDKDKWPESNIVSLTEVPELKKECSVLMSSQAISYIERFSSLTRLQRVTAWILRFKNNSLCAKENRTHGPLNSTELRTALDLCIKLTQEKYFHQEIKDLSNGKTQYKGPLKNLSPFISTPGLLRVGGRISSAPLPESSKHPILIPRDSHLSTLIIDYYHLYSLHGNTRLVQSLIQREFWIPAIRTKIKHQIHKCLKCYKLTAKPQVPYMADLPPSRFAQGRCFTNVIVDFAGHFLLKSGNRRNSPIVKCYFAIFVCMSVKAVHLELVHSLSSESCLAAIDRFVARRGLPCNIYSDNGTNFKAAARHINEVQQCLQDNEEKIVNHCSSKNIVWHFNPPSAPNFSGLAEAGVKSAKYHLKRILNDRPLNYEEFSTLLCQVEAVLNSRPLCAVSNLPDDGTDYLTPGHFLIGSSLLTRPEHDYTNEPQNRLCRWKLLTQVTQNFWKQWSTEYLHTLLQRTKWHEKKEDLKIDDLVLISSNLQGPLQWPLARIKKVFPGQDGVVRVVEVETQNGILTRPVSKLIPLPKE